MSRKFNKAVASTVACLVVTSVVQMPAFAATKLAGEGRIDTAIAIAQESWNNNWKGQTTVVLTSANNDNLVDALAVAPLAFQEKAPILLTENGDVVNPKVMDELKAKKVTKVYLTAGVGVQSAKMEKQLTDAGMTVVRLGGNDRYETAKNIAAKLTKINGVAVVNGYAVIDALSVASTAAANGYAIAMASNADTLDVNIPKDVPVYAIGGSGVLSDALVTKLNAKRLGGADRYKTNAAVIEGLQTAMKFDKVYVANGMPAGNGVDALAGSVLAAQTNSPIVITGDSLDATQTAILAKKASKDVKVVQLGGAVSAVAELEKALTPVVSADLKVEGVTATNLREVNVSLSAAIDEDTVTTDNFTVSKVDGSNIILKSASLNDDKKSVKLVVLNKLDNQSKYMVKVESVKDAAGKVIVKSSTDFTVFDGELPTVKGITVTGPRNFTIQFSEPLETITTGVITVKSGDSVIGVAPIEGTVGASKVKVALYSDLADGVSYDISIKDFADFAGYKNVANTQTLKYVKDATAPTAKVTKIEQQYVVVEFNKPVTGLTKNHFYHTFSAWTAQDIYSDADMKTLVAATDSVSKVYVKFSGKDADGKITGTPLAAGNINLTVLGKASDVQVKDNWDNKFADATLTLAATADLVAPTVTELKVTSEQALKVKFSEDVVFSKDNVEVLAKDGSKIDGLSLSVTAVDDSKKEYTINLGKDLAGKGIKVNIKDVKDLALAPNKMAAVYTQDLEVTDKTAPTVKMVTKKIIENGEKSIYVFYNENVDSTAVSADSYYMVNAGVYTKLSGTPVYANGTKVVKLSLTKSEAEKVVSTTQILVSNVKDTAGNALVGSINSLLAYDDATNKPSVAKLQATETKKLVVTFDQYLTRVDSAMFKINTEDVAGMTLSTNDDGNTVVTLQSKTDFVTSASGITLTISNTGTARATNMFGVDLNTTIASTVVVKDKIAPAIAKLAAADTSKLDTTFDMVGKTTVRIKFTEAIDTNSLSKYTYTVKDAKVKSVAVDANDARIVVITLTEAVDTVKLPKLYITQALDLTDAALNTFKYDKEFSVATK